MSFVCGETDSRKKVFQFESVGDSHTFCKTLVTSSPSPPLSLLLLLRRAVPKTVPPSLFSWMLSPPTRTDLYHEVSGGGET